LRVLWITERFPPDRGGLASAAARQVAALAPHLAGLDVLKLATDLPPGRVEVDARWPMRLYRVGRATPHDEALQLLARAAESLVARHGHRIIHGFGAVHAGYVATTVARLTGRRAVVSLRGNDVDRAMFHGPRLPFLLWTLHHADALLGVSREILEKATMLTGRRDGLHHVPNGVDASVFRPDTPPPDDLAALAGHPRPHPRPWIATSGELRLKKGLPLLLDLTERLAAEGRGTVVLIGGVRADERSGVEHWRRVARRVARRVTDDASARLVELPYTHDQKRLAGLYASMDLVVFPSLWDGMPNALLEAMACARPVLATAVGGAPDVIVHGENGFLLPPDRFDEFPAEVLATLTRGPELARIGAAARERVRDAFTVEREVDSIRAVYDALDA
jgi:glycosyltransferase involved in cell wall biosynthesis